MTGMGTRILIVDDSDTSVQILRRHLQTEPFQLLTAKEAGPGSRWRIRSIPI
jgi:DNA-binding response OmpR family regulator